MTRSVYFCYGLLLMLLMTGCRQKTLFTLLSSSSSGITFNNKITESDSLNPLTEVNIYNGGGVGIGDFNGDGLEDIYFTGNMVLNQLYLNQGDLQFLDVTTASGADGEGKWCRGVSVIDINGDGKSDIYVSVSMSPNPEKRRNLLYVNQGNDNNGIPVFKQLAPEYGLDDDSHTTMADFFDYDNDGDLDVYLVVNEHAGDENQNVFKPVSADGSHPSTGRLYRNDWNDSLRHGVYVNVSREAGILIEGYGHSAIVGDINSDGWKDIYVANDFLSSNILYINNRDGTFTDRAKEYFKQTSLYSMGVDMQDLNNDGLEDIVELDMNPQDNYRKKMMLGPNNYQNVQSFPKYDYLMQYSRNTVQINQGPAVYANDSVGAPVFSQLGYLCGVSETDWSWTPMVNDFDNDGFRDLIVTNGFPKDVTDHDFMVFRSHAYPFTRAADILSQIPEVKLHNYAFKNINGLQFNNHTVDWGFSTPGFSNGAAYADLDNDGDMDIVINNINDAAFVYRNNFRPAPDKHYLNIAFEGGERNPSGFGTRVRIYYGAGLQQVYEQNPYRGYLSSVGATGHFGLADHEVIDSLIVLWQNGKKQTLRNVATDRLITVNISDAKSVEAATKPVVSRMFDDVTDSVNLSYTDWQKDYVDFNVQKLLPHKFGEYSPGLAAGDLNGDGLDDIVCGGNSKNPAQLFLQDIKGRFSQRGLFPVLGDTSLHKYGRYGILTNLDFKDEGILLFDADNDGDQDLYISSGGYEHDPNTKAYQDRLYVNNGQGIFLQDTAALPVNYTSKFCVRAADFDRDGDLDLFVAGRVEPWDYPKPVSSIILRNDSRMGKIRFTDVTSQMAAGLNNIGLVCDAVFTDFDNDGWTDLVLAGEWMSPAFFKNEQGIFTDAGAGSGVADAKGWWNSIAPGDFDNDGDIDYIIGNLGLNSFYKASARYPVHITAGFFDNNPSYDAFPSIFLPASQDDTTRKEFPVHQWEDVNKQMIGMRARFPNFKTYAKATFDKLLTAEQLENALRLEVNTLESVILRNDGKGHFTKFPLPLQAQVSVLNGMTVDDYDGDGNLDALINGNDYGTEVSVGRYDALNGLLMKGDGQGDFLPQTMVQSGINIPGNGKALVSWKSAGGSQMIVASQNNGPLKAFRNAPNVKLVKMLPGDVSAVITLSTGRQRKQELYYGFSFLSQSARWLNVPAGARSVVVFDSRGNSRKLR